MVAHLMLIQRTSDRNAGIIRRRAPVVNLQLASLLGSARFERVMAVQIDLNHLQAEEHLADHFSGPKP